MFESQLAGLGRKYSDQSAFDTMVIDRLRVLGRGRPDYFVAVVTSTTADTMSLHGSDTVLCSGHPKNRDGSYYYGPKPCESGESDPGDIMLQPDHIRIKYDI